MDCKANVCKNNWKATEYIIMEIQSELMCQSTCIYKKNMYGINSLYMNADYMSSDSS
jgi:hypothetical protein